jgi:hypothetical protein
MPATSEFISGSIYHLFLARHALFKPLQTLLIQSSVISMSDTELMECLQLTPMLTELGLESHSSLGLTPTVLARLSPHPQIQCLVPKLRSLMFQRLADFDNNAFVNMIWSRWKTGLDDMASAAGNTIVRLCSI